MCNLRKLPVGGNYNRDDVRLFSIHLLENSATTGSIQSVNENASKFH